MSKQAYSLKPYDPEWVNKFEAIKNLLTGVFGPKALAIEHIGSTAIPGMKAKPVIDALVLVEKMEPFAEEKERMCKLGYEYKENYVVPDSILFYRTIGNEKTENIHVLVSGSEKADKLLTTRDYLRSHPDEVKEYENLKEKLHEQHPDDYIAYREGKAQFLEKINRLAQEWKFPRFYDSWKNKTPIEVRAIEALEKAIKFLFENIEKEKIVAIYVKGSFVNREMNEKSDVDIVPIAKDNETLLKILELDRKSGERYRPAEFLPFSLWELEHNERQAKYETLKGRPDLFLADLEHHKLIYGEPLDISKFPIRSDEERFNALRHAIEKSFIPGYREKKVGIGNLAKFTLWLTYLEQKVKGKKLGHSSKAIAEAVENKNHIVHQALEFRLRPTKNEAVREAFVRKLSEFVQNLKTDKKMEILKVLNEENVSEEEATLLKQRIAVRAVILDRDKIVILHAKNKGYYELPGGGAEEGETPETALLRECKEETGCEVEIIKPIGRVLELRKKSGISNDSHAYIAKVISRGLPTLTEEEIKEGKETMWVTPDEAKRLILSSDVSKNFYHQYPRDRDLSILKTCF